MDQRLSIVTLGVADLARARRFYLTGLGWKESAASSPQISFIDAGGVVLALYNRVALASDANLPQDRRQGRIGFSGITLAHNVRDRKAVDVVIAKAIAAGGARLKPGLDAFWGGYSGYFADPDGHVWEVAWNPHFKLDRAGRIVLPPPKKKSPAPAK